MLPWHVKKPCAVRFVHNYSLSDHEKMHDKALPNEQKGVSLQTEVRITQATNNSKDRI